MIVPSKRLFIKTGLLVALGFSSGLPVFGKYSNTIGNSSKNMNYLIDTLNSINKPVCTNVAKQLAALKADARTYDLHLRRADLNDSDVEYISKAIGLIHAAKGPLLESFSMSYNADITNEGVLNLIESLPSSVTEIGLVGCGISDDAGEALVNWALKAPKLHWLCVEQNSFSEMMKNRLMKLSQKTKGLLVIV